MITYQINIVPKWEINFTKDYFVSVKNKVHNLKTGKEIKISLKGYTKGYNLNGKFYSLLQLRKSLIKYKEINCPF